MDEQWESGGLPPRLVSDPFASYQKLCTLAALKELFLIQVK